MESIFLCIYVLEKNWSFETLYEHKLCNSKHTDVIHILIPYIGLCINRMYVSVILYHVNNIRVECKLIFAIFYLLSETGILFKNARISRISERKQLFFFQPLRATYKRGGLCPGERSPAGGWVHQLQMCAIHVFPRGHQFGGGWTF